MKRIKLLLALPLLALTACEPSEGSGDPPACIVDLSARGDAPIDPALVIMYNSYPLYEMVQDRVAWYDFAETYMGLFEMPALSLVQLSACEDEARCDPFTEFSPVGPEMTPVCHVRETDNPLESCLQAAIDLNLVQYEAADVVCSALVDL